jgi:hypothetical protein
MSFKNRSLARALDASEPVEEPQPHGTGDIENHLPDLDLEFAIRSCHGHRFSLPLVRISMSDSHG